MLKANLQIISSLKFFLITVSRNNDYLKLFRNTDTDFTRNRKLSFDRLVLLIVQLCKKTLSVEIENLFKEFNVRLSCSVAAFSLQRMKLNPSFFYAWNIVLWTNFYSAYGKKIKRWKGFRVLGCDGSSISLVNRPQLYKYFGGQSNQTSSYVIAKTFYCYDVLNNMILFPAIAPYRYDELRMACDIIDSGNITSDMLMIFDRFFSNYKMAAILEFQEKKIKYVIRVNENYNFSKRFIESKKKSAVIDLFPSYAAIKSLREYKYKVSIATPVKVRLIRIKLPTGKIEVLMTNLWEEEGYAVDEFKLLYSLRWGVETNINFQKNILQLESLSGLSPLSVMQDFFATVFISNLHHLLLKPAQETINKTVIRKYPMKINNNKAFGKIKENLIHLFITFEPQNILKKLHDYFIKWILPIRNNRSFPRIRKNPQSKSKYRTFTNYKPTY